MIKSHCSLDEKWHKAEQADFPHPINLKVVQRRTREKNADTDDEWVEKSIHYPTLFIV